MGSFMSKLCHRTSVDNSARIVEQVESHIRRRLGGQMSDLRVLVQTEGLVLRGRCRSYHAKQLALHAATEMTDLPILSNEIRV